MQRSVVMVRFLSKIFQRISNDFNFLCGPSFCTNSKNCQILESEDIVVLDDNQNDIYAWRPLGYLGMDGGLDKCKLSLLYVYYKFFLVLRVKKTIK